MGNSDAAGEAANSTREVAARFVRARLDGTALPGYPGPLPGDLAEAYARQDAAIALWPDVVAGWKVGKIGDDWAAQVGEERLVGPIFRRQLRPVPVGAILDLPVIPGGFAAVEAEYVFVLGRAAPADRVDWTPEAAAELVGELRVGVEFAGSPLATINELGPAVVVSDFGNNAGLLLGPAIADWQAQPLASLTCETFIGERSVGRGGAASISGGPLAALAFALGRCARRGRPLHAGDVVSTGASTGIHDIRIGEQARVVFGGMVEIRCHATGALPSTFRPRDAQA